MKKADSSTIEYYLTSAKQLASIGDYQGASSMALTGLYEMMPHVESDGLRFIVQRMMNASDLFGVAIDDK
jgi:hypothetical protein